MQVVKLAASGRMPQAIVAQLARSASVTPNIWRRPCSPSRQRLRSVGTIRFVGKAAAKIADDGGIPLP